MMRKIAQPSAWARGPNPQPICDHCGKVFHHPSQYMFIGDEVICRRWERCERQARAQKRAPTAVPVPPAADHVAE